MFEYVKIYTHDIRTHAILYGEMQCKIFLMLKKNEYAHTILEYISTVKGKVTMLSTLFDVTCE